MSVSTSQSKEPKETVILLHGLGRSPWSLWRVARVLRREGYKVINTNYASRRHHIEELVRDYLTPLIAAHQGAPRLHFVTHSMGGILLRCYLRENVITNLGRVVMLAPPNGGSELADRLLTTWIYRAVNGPAGQQLGVHGIAAKLGHWPASAGPLGVIAGDVSLNPVFSAWLPGPSDGKVTVAKTRLTGMSDFAVLHSSHTWLAWRQPVILQIRSFLRTGHFVNSKYSPPQI